MQDQVFISYSHADEKLMKELLKHLKPYARSGAIAAWSDKQIAPGGEVVRRDPGGVAKDKRGGVARES